jgi:hypothetical protein
MIYGELELQLHAFLTSALDGVSGQLHASVALLPKTPYHSTGGWVGSTTGLEKLLRPYLESNHDSSIALLMA